MVHQNLRLPDVGEHRARAEEAVRMSAEVHCRSSERKGQEAIRGTQLEQLLLQGIGFKKWGIIPFHFTPQSWSNLTRVVFFTKY